MAFAEISIRDTATLTSDARMARPGRAARSLLADVAEYWHRWNLVVSRKPSCGLAGRPAGVRARGARRRRGAGADAAAARAALGDDDAHLYFITSRGHARLRQCVAEHDCAWARRTRTGGGRPPATRTRAHRRIAFWRAHRDEADLALTRLDHRRHRGLPVSPKTPVAEHLRHRYQVDLEGHSCSWDGLFWKLLSNSTVLRVEQPDEQWYHRRLRPWVHYVPCTVATFPRRLAWCRAHPEACARMAEAAALAASLTSRSRRSTLRARWRDGSGSSRGASARTPGPPDARRPTAEMAENEHGRIAKPP